MLDKQGRCITNITKVYRYNEPTLHLYISEELNKTHFIHNIIEDGLYGRYTLWLS